MSFEQKYQHIVNTIIYNNYKDIIPTDNGIYIIYKNNNIEFIPYENKSEDKYNNIIIYLINSESTGQCFLSTKQKVINHYIRHVQKWFYKDFDFMDILDCVSVRKSPKSKNKSKNKQKYIARFEYDEKNKLTKEIITVKLKFLIENDLLNRKVIELALSNFIKTFNVDYCILNDRKKQIKDFIKKYIAKEIRRYIKMKVQMKNTWLI